MRRSFYTLPFVTRLEQSINQCYGQVIKDMGIRIKITSNPLLYTKSSACFTKITRTITVNCSDQVLKKNEYSINRYLCIIAHELGHAYDYLIVGRKDNVLLSLLSSKYNRNMVHIAEYNAYHYGKQYVPYSLRRQYTYINNTYLRKLGVL